MNNEWVIQKGSAYSLGDDWIGSEIYVNIDGEMAEICTVNLVLTQSERFKLRQIENEYDNMRYSEIGEKKHWWQRIKFNNDDWKLAHEKYMREREEIYKRPKVLHDKYLSIILAAQSAVNLLESYKHTGVMDDEILERTLAIAKGEIAPMFQYSGQICSCGHPDKEHDTKYEWAKNRGGCTVENCDCKRFERATDIVGEIKTYNLIELREKNKLNSD